MSLLRYRQEIGIRSPRFVENYTLPFVVCWRCCTVTHIGHQSVVLQKHQKIRVCMENSNDPHLNGSLLRQSTVMPSFGSYCSGIYGRNLRVSNILQSRLEIASKQSSPAFENSSPIVHTFRITPKRVSCSRSRL